MPNGHKHWGDNYNSYLISMSMNDIEECDIFYIVPNQIDGRSFDGRTNFHRCKFLGTKKSCERNLQDYTEHKIV